MLTLWAIGLIVGCTLWGYVADRVLKTRKGVICGGAVVYAFLWVLLGLEPERLPGAVLQHRDVLGRLLCFDVDPCLCPAQGGRPISGDRDRNGHTESLFLGRRSVLSASQCALPRVVPKADRTHSRDWLSNAVLDLFRLRRRRRSPRRSQYRTTRCRTVPVSRAPRSRIREALAPGSTAGQPTRKAVVRSGSLRHEREGVAGPADCSIEPQFTISPCPCEFAPEWFQPWFLGLDTAVRAQSSAFQRTPRRDVSSGLSNGPRKDRSQPLARSATPFVQGTDSITFPETRRLSPDQDDTRTGRYCNYLLHRNIPEGLWAPQPRRLPPSGESLSEELLLSCLRELLR